MAEHANSTPVRLRAPLTVQRAARTLPDGDPLRIRLEAACDRLERLAAQIIADLDLVEGDPDLEDPDLEDGGDDEPSLGATEYRDQRRWAAQEPGARDLDREEQCEDEGGACEDEGAEFDREPDDDDLCDWRSGEVDQRDLGSGYGGGDRYIDLGA